MKSKMAMQAYRNADRNAAAESNDPHTLISVLLAELPRQIRRYVDCVNGPGSEQRQESEHLAKSLTLIHGLQTSLNFEQGGQIADNLFRLYEYARQQLLNASRSRNTDGVDAAIKALEDISEAWNQINTTGGGEEKTDQARPSSPVGSEGSLS